MKWIKYFLMLCGAAVSVYGFTQNDSELIVFSGVFLVVIGLMLKNIIEIFIEKKDNSNNKT